MDFTGFGWSIFWIFGLGAALFAYLWSRSMRRRASQAPRLYMEALKALVDGDDRLAFDRLKMTVTEDSNNLDAYLKLGDLLRKRGRHDRAIRVHEELTLRLGMSKPALVGVQKSLALDYLAAGNLQHAESSLQKIIELDKENLWAWNHLVELYETSERFDEAFDARKTILKISGQKDGQSLALYKTLQGAKLANEGKRSDARGEFRDALNYDGQSIPALLYLGDAYWDEGRPGDAVEWWSKLATTHPESAHLVFSRLERAYFDLGQYGEITKFYEKVLESHPNSTTALLGLADLSLKKGELDRAMTQYRHVLDIEAANIPARAGIVSALARMKRWPQVAEEVDRLLGGKSITGTSFTCGKCGHPEPEPVWFCPSCKHVGPYQGANGKGPSKPNA